MLIAQISDIHANVDNDNLGRLEQALAWLAALKPDVLIISGDLVDAGWKEGYARIAAALRPLPFRTLVLPGNADEKIVMRSTMSEFLGQADDFRMHFAERHGEVILLGLDATVDGAPYGDVTEHLGWLKQKLTSAQDGIPLLFMHHHVFRSGITPMDEVMCKGIDCLADLLSSGVARPMAICTGHVHRPMASVIAGLPTYICGSICPANPLLLDERQVAPVTDPPTLMVYMVKNRRLVSNHVSLSQS